MSDLFHWPFYAMVTTGVLGTVLCKVRTRGPLAASHSSLLIVDPLASIGLGIELFHEPLRTGPIPVRSRHFARRTGGRVIMLSVWAPPVMSAEELARLTGRARSGEDVAPRRVAVPPELSP